MDGFKQDILLCCQPSTEKRCSKRANSHVLENGHKDGLISAKLYSNKQIKEIFNKSFIRVFVRVLAGPKWFLLRLD